MTVRVLIALFFYGWVFIANGAENDEGSRLYFDKDWYETSLENASFYRPIPLQKEGDLYLLKDYYMSGQLQAEAYTHSEDEIIFEGKAVWYYENGQVSIERHYKDGQASGEERSYYENGQLKLERTRPTGKATWYYENGQIRIVRYYENNKTSGEEISYFDNGALRSQGTYSTDGHRFNGTFLNHKGDPRYQVVEYKDGSIVGYLSFYQDSKTLAEYKQAGTDYQTKQKRYYNKVGELLSEVEYNPSHSSQPELTIGGTEQLFSYNNDGYVIDIIGQTTVTTNDAVINFNTTINEISEPIIGSFDNDTGYDGEIYNFRNGEIITFVNGHKNGRLRCCYNRNVIRTEGIYKDYAHNGSFYDEYDNKVANYKNGVQDGKTIYFDEDFNAVAESNYVNGYIDGKRTTYNPFSKETFEAEYRNGEPVNGSVYEYNYLKTYQNKTLIEETRYQDNSAKKVEKSIFAADNSYRLLAKENYVSEKIYRIDYKDNQPYNGEDYRAGQMHTYKDGELDGPYFIQGYYTNSYREDGQYIDGKKQGKVTYQLDSETFSATFKDDVPIDGTMYDAYSGGKSTYKDGKKNGTFTVKNHSQYFDYDTAVSSYQDDIPVDTVSYYSKGNKVAEGEYKDGKPFDGEFYSSSYRQSSYQKLKQGQLVESSETIDDQLTNRWYDNGQLSQEDITIDKQIYSLTYQHGKPWQGQHVEIKTDGNYYTKEKIITDYSNGMKNGTQLIYADSYIDEPSAEKNYVNDQLSGNQYYYLGNGIRFSATYDNGKPLQGEVVDKLSQEAFAITEYENGVAQEVNFIGGGYGSYYKTWVEGQYQNGTPYSGFFYSVYSSAFSIDYYEHGVKLKSYIEPRLYYDKTLNDNDYAAKSIVSMKPGQDEVRFAYGNYAILNYSDDSKQSGKLETFSSYDELVSSVDFNNNQITAVSNAGKLIPNNDYRFPFSYYSYQLSEGGKSLVISGEDSSDLKIKIEVPSTFSPPAYITLSSLENYLAQYPRLTFNYYYKDNAKPVASYRMENNLPMSGIVITPPYYADDNNNYRFDYYENRQIVDSKKMTMEAFIEANIY